MSRTIWVLTLLLAGVSGGCCCPQFCRSHCSSEVRTPLHTYSCYIPSSPTCSIEERAYKCEKEWAKTSAPTSVDPRIPRYTGSISVKDIRIQRVTEVRLGLLIDAIETALSTIDHTLDEEKTKVDGKTITLVTKARVQGKYSLYHILTVRIHTDAESIAFTIDSIGEVYDGNRELLPLKRSTPKAFFAELQEALKGTSN